MSILLDIFQPMLNCFILQSISIFESGDALGGYLEGDVREKELLPLLEQAKELAVDGDIKMQNFVYDEHK